LEEFDVVVIGGGPAAITITKNIGGKKKVGIIRPELVTNTGASLIRDRVEKVDFNSKTVFTKKGKNCKYEQLIIATGANPILPPIAGYDLKGVTTFKTENDLKKILAATRNGLKKAVVIGAGAIGVEVAQAFNKLHVETFLIDMAEHLLPHMMDYEMVEKAEEELTKSGIELHLKSKVTSLRGKQFIEDVVLEKGQIIHLNSLDECSTAEQEYENAGLVVFAVGMKPNTEIFQDTELNIGNDGIIINEKMETNIKDVFAVGDCTQFKSAVNGEIISGKLATNAVPMGKIVAKNILGKERQYKGFYNGAATKMGNYFVGGTGITEKKAQENFDIVVGYSEFTTAFPIMPFAQKVRMKLIADKNTLKIIGGQVVSGAPVTDKVDLITMAIQYGITVRELVNLSYSAQPYQSFFPANNLMVQASENILNEL